jgi:hypothetical protein
MNAVRALALAAVLLFGCDRPRRDEADVLPPHGYVEPETGPPRRVRPQSRGKARFGATFYPLEIGVDGTSWRWMPKTGTIELERPEADARLRIRGWGPAELLAAPSTLSITIAGRPLDTFVFPAGHFTREWTVRLGSLGTGAAVTLALSVSATASAPGDSRSLGFAIEAIDWEPL